MLEARTTLALCVSIVLSLASGAFAQAPSVSSVPLPDWVKSGEVNEDGVVVFSAADEHSPRRGTVAIGTRLSVVARVAGVGCGNFRFVQIADEAFVCEQALTWSKEVPMGIPLPLMAAGSLLPFEYLFVAGDGIGGYARPSDVEADDFANVFAQGFGVAVKERVTYEGTRFVRSAHGYYLREAELRARSVSEFAGVTISDGKLDDLAWVVRERVQRRATAKAKGSVVLPRLSLVHVAEVETGGNVRLADGGYVSARDIVRPVLVPKPSDVLDDERYIDVDTQRQTLVVYEGSRPIFATLVSTGIAGEGTETPTGSFRIWAKLTSSDMNDTEDIDKERNYSIESVPFVMYFHEGVALHTAFWHDRFGEKHSHGCVNLSPRDARTVFGLATPALPDGFYAILPTDKAPGMRVIVR